jgi:hypothetical protein
MQRLVACLLVVGACAPIADCSSSATSAESATGSPPGSSQSAELSPLSAAAYRRVLARIGSEEDRAQHNVQLALRAHTAAEVRSALAAFAADQQHVAAALRSTVPPPDARAANAALAHAFADNAAAVRQVAARIAHAASAKAALQVIQGASTAQRAGHEIDAALGRLRKLGYTSGS